MGLIIFLLRKDMNMRGNRQTTSLPLTFINFTDISNKKTAAEGKVLRGGFMNDFSVLLLLIF